MSEPTAEGGPGNSPNATSPAQPVAPAQDSAAQEAPPASEANVEASGGVAPAEAERVTRKCEACGQEDDHPRHIIYFAQRHPLYPDDDTKIIDFSTEKHLDCCAADGCHDKSCDEHLKNSSGAKGHDLVKYLESLPPQEEAPAHPVEQQPVGSEFWIEHHKDKIVGILPVPGGAQ